MNLLNQDVELVSKLTKVYAVGVGPGSPKQVTDFVKNIILQSDVVVGYKYTLQTIKEHLSGKDVREITMTNQEEVYQNVLKEMPDKTMLVPFTGDVNFSESEVVDRLIHIFKDVEIIPGISSVQIAASKVPGFKAGKALKDKVKFG